MFITQCFKGGFIFLIRCYRRFISPYFRSSCRYYPSCSLYALVLFELTHPFNALFFSIIRVFKCNPWSKGGYDYPMMKVKISKLEYQPIRVRYWFIPLKPLKIPICIKKPVVFRAYILLKD